MKSVRFIGISSFVLVSLFSFALQGMKPVDTDAPRGEEFTLLSSFATDIPSKIVHAIANADEGSHIRIAQLFFTHPKIVKALKKFLSDGKGTIFIWAGTSHKNTKKVVDELRELGAEIIESADMHMKCFSISSAEDKKSHTFFGSENLSSFANKHFECVVYSNEASFAHEMGDMIDRTSKDAPLPDGKKRKVTFDTPQKKGALETTADSDLNEGLCKRIQKPLVDDEQEKLTLMTMTFDDEKIADALEKKKKLYGDRCDITLMVHGSVIKSKKSKKLIDQLFYAGITIYIYNEDGAKEVFTGSKIPKLQHIKMFYRKRATKENPCADTLVVVGTGNYTHRSNQEINAISYFAHDAKIAEQAENIIEHVMVRSKRYAPLKSSVRRSILTDLTDAAD